MSMLMVGPATHALAQQSPEEELQALQVAPEMDVQLFASEPLITNPSAIDIDTQGRVWVAEIQWYRRAAKVPPADKIKVLEDTDGDGHADKVTVFAEGVFAPMSICVAGDKVYVATSPDLWVYEDKDGDLRADGPAQKLLTGFGGQNHDHGAHSLVLGPDHKWWMSHGDTGFDVTGTDGSHIQYQWGGMLRGELDGSQLELVAQNFRNPYEICMSSFGEAFCSDNDNDGNFSVRICWILEGGNYGWYGGPPAKVPPGTPFGEHWHFRGHIPGHVPATLVTGFGSPCGIYFYEGDAFGEHFKNAPLHADAGPREVRIYRHERSGAGMSATSEVFMTSTTDNYFRPDDVCAAPDGSLYVSDWYDGGVGGHAYNNPDQGRIFVLRPRGKKLARIGKPGPYKTVAEAIEGLKNPNLATQYLARERLLAEGQRATGALKSLLNATDGNHRARALWVLDRIGGEARRQVAEQLASAEDTFRALAVRILRRHGEEYSDAILALASDSSAEVRREVLLAIRKLPQQKATEVLVKLASAYDGQDRYLLEAINVAAEGRKAELFAALGASGDLTLDKVQLLQLLDAKAAAEFLAKNLASTNLDEAARASLLAHLGGTNSIDAGKAVLSLARDESATKDLRKLAVNLLATNLAGTWQGLKQEFGFSEDLRKLLRDEACQQETLTLAVNQGLTDLGLDILALAKSDQVSLDVRQQAMLAAARLRADGAAQVLGTLLGADQAELRQTALEALVELQAWPVVKQILAGKLGTPELQTLAVEKVMASSAGALVMLRLIEEKSLSESIQQASIAIATSHPDSNIRVLYEKFIPEKDRPQRLGSAIRAEEILALDADARRGEQIFFQSTAAQCKNCHRVHGAGASLGPDLSQIGRKYERATLLETILDPSKAIAPEFVPYLMETEGGLVYAGFLVEKTDEHVILKDAQNKLVHVPSMEVELLAPQQKSLMPELVLRDVTAQDAADLLAYLVSLNQTVQPVTRFRVMGPFASPDLQGIDHDFGPEASLAAPDLEAGFQGAADRLYHWEAVDTDFSLGFQAIDQVKYCQKRGFPAEAVTLYYLVYADSVAEQDATLLLGSDDSAKVWLNGKEIHAVREDRAVAPGQDKLAVRLLRGRNVIVVKVENHQGPGGVCLSVSSSASVQLRTE